MTFIWFLLIGILSGWIAGELTRGSGFGLMGNLIVGVLGALVGGFLFDVLGVSAYGLTGRLVLSVIGAIILLFIASLFNTSSKKALLLEKTFVGLMPLSPHEARSCRNAP